jgi:hypothetical protein
MDGAKTHRFRFRVTETEAEEIRETADSMGYLTVSHFLRDIVLKEIKQV